MFIKSSDSVSCLVIQFGSSGVLRGRFGSGSGHSGRGWGFGLDCLGFVVEQSDGSESRDCQDCERGCLLEQRLHQRDCGD